MSTFVPPVLDTTPYDRDELAVIAAELSRLVSGWQALNLAMLAEVQAVDSVGETREERIAAVADALGAAIVTWAASLDAAQEGTMARIGAALGQPGFSLQ